MELQTYDEVRVMVAHEMKNPISLALANVGLIRMQDQEGRFQRQCDAITKELSGLNRLVTDFLDASDGTFHDLIDDEQTEIGEIIENLVNRYKNAYMSIDLIWNRPQSEIYIQADQKQLEILFGNIIKNAAEAVEREGIIEICVSVGDGYLEVKVMDTGAGIGHSYRKKKGNGMGLHICRDIARRLGGEFSLENGTNGGAVARVALPIIG